MFPFLSAKRMPLIGSIFCVAYILGLYYLDPSLYANIYLRHFVFVFVFLFMGYAAVYSSYIKITSLRPFVKPPFMAFALIMFWIQFAHVAIFNYIHPEDDKPLSEVFRKAEYDFQYKRLKAGGAPEIEFKKMKAEIDHRQYGLSADGALKQYIYYLFAGFAVSMILALLMQYRVSKKSIGNNFYPEK